MNKLLIVGILSILLIGGAFLFRTVFLKGKLCMEGQGDDVEITMTSKENQWEFDPPVIEFNKCDRVTIAIYNEDEYDHGFAIDVFGVNRRIDPLTTTAIHFTASKAGEFVFYCSVPCGDGHFGHKGTVRVFDIVE